MRFSETGVGVPSIKMRTNQDGSLESESLKTTLKTIEIWVNTT
jgi:hypothetical protein